MRKATVNVKFKCPVCLTLINEYNVVVQTIATMLCHVMADRLDLSYLIEVYERDVAYILGLL